VVIKSFKFFIGQKVILSLTGLFLCTFLLVHLIGNLQLIFDDGGKAFNQYAQFMGNNFFIQFTAKGLYAIILVHAIKGLLMAWNNRKARGASRYAVSTNKNASWASKNMAILGSWIFIFIGIHMSKFWYKMKWGDLPKVNIDGASVTDLYTEVSTTYENPFIVAFYVISMIMIGAHLWHGFGSAFQTLGLNHKKYTPIIDGLGKAFSVLIPGAFCVIPIWMYFN